MAIDFLIFALLLLSFIINFLALTAFWITPGLRTAANRFTINLLIINLIGCLILAPTLFLSHDINTYTISIPRSNRSSSSGGITSDTIELSGSTFFDNIENKDSFDFLLKPGNPEKAIRHNGNLNRNSTKWNGQIFKCNSTHCSELNFNRNTIVITEIDNEIEREVSTLPTFKDDIRLLSHFETRSWSIDMAAALGALAVLLVVGDTWCAVTDPLRYHSRISGIKTWIFIGLTWSIGILFGTLSAFRVLNYETDTVLNKHQHVAITYLNWSSANSIFGIVYASAYFVIIIMLPFGFVCGMYWRIFSEARENSLRMRQNGSSPLLQSALNLNHQPHSSSIMQQYTNRTCIQRSSISSSASSNYGGHTGGLHMQIDQHKSCVPVARLDSAAKVLLPTISDDGISIETERCNGNVVVMTQQQDNALADGNHNILLTLQTASGEIKRNYSARQLPLLGTSSQDFHESARFHGIRQVHSSPNLQKYTQMLQSSLTVENCSPHLLGHQEPHVRTLVYPFPEMDCHQALNSSNHQRRLSQVTQLAQNHVLQIPSIHTSPKNLSYMSSLRHRLSNASSLFKYRDESRAARISILVVIMFLVSYLPYGVLVMVQSQYTPANFEYSTQVAIFMILLGNLSSAFIFAYRNKRVRRGIKRLFGFEKPRHERSLTRHSTSSMRGSIFLKQSCTPKKAQQNSYIQRSSGRISTYLSNSCKNLMAQNSLVVSPILNKDTKNDIQNLSTTTPIHQHKLRPNSSCSTIINFASQTSVDNFSTTEEASHSIMKDDISKTNKNLMNIAVNPKHESTSPKFQRAITFKDKTQMPTKQITAKRNGFLKKMFHSSQQSASTLNAPIIAVLPAIHPVDV